MRIKVHEYDNVTHYYRLAFQDEGHQIVDEDPDVFFTDTSSLIRKPIGISSNVFNIVIVADAPKEIPSFIHSYDLGLSIVPIDMPLKILEQPWAYSPHYFYDMENKRDLDLIFVGGNHHNFQSKLGHKFFNRTPKDTGALLNRGLMTYRMGAMHNTADVKRLTLLPFEAAACKTMCLNYRSPDTFKGIVQFDTQAELKELSDYYFENEDERNKKIAQALESIKGHSFNDRVKEVLKHVK